MYQCGGVLLESTLLFEEVASRLALDPLVERALKREFGKAAAETLISQLKLGVCDGGLRDFLEDLLQNAGRFYTRFTALGPYKDTYHIDVRGLGGVYFASANEFDNLQYFTSLREAERASGELVANEKVSSGRHYRRAFGNEQI